MPGLLTNGTPRQELGRDVLTTGQVSRLTGAAPRSVADWCDSGELPCFHVPSRNKHHQDRRICRDDLAAFLKRTGQTKALSLLMGEVGLAGPVLLLGLSAGLAGPVLKAVPGAVLLEDALAAGAWCARLPPSAACLEAAAYGRSQTALMVGFLARQFNVAPRVVVLAAEDDADEAGWLGAGAAAVVRQPASWQEVVRALAPPGTRPPGS